MLRIRFGPGDVGKVRLLTPPPPVLEMLNLLAAAVQLDFLDDDCPRLEGTLERIRQTPSDVMAADLTNCLRTHPTRCLDGLADGRVGAVTHLMDSLAAFYADRLESDLGVVRQSLDREERRVEHTMSRFGVDALLATLHAGIIWRDETLHAPHPRDWDVRLRGDGLRLMPSAYVAGRVRLAFARRGGAPILMYPARPVPPSAGGSPGGLSRLLGSTRAAVLRSLRTPASTTELAMRVVTERDGLAVRHSLSDLGDRFLSEQRQRS